MKKMVKIITLLMAIVSLAGSGSAATFTGTAIVYGSGFNSRTLMRSFTLKVDRETSDEDALRLVNILEDRGQDALMSAIHNEDMGRFSLGGGLSRPLNGARIERVDGKIRVRAVFERWLGFGELRGGYRSIDYPFGYIELLIDPRTRKGEGTFISAARIRFRSNNGQNMVYVEDFGTYPGRLVNVKMSGMLPR